ncbi:MAG TPA: IPT/TIG domain-containing protein, partial [Candidatus Acidoferrales bacterium]|nr:IPT/TIG domain-containing protein [Candidatus Acidoferrales bacterium]
MTAIFSRRRVALGVAIIVMLAVASIVFNVLSQKPEAGGTASLTILTGTVSVQKSGTAATHPASSGDQLGSGDLVTTGPSPTKALINYPDGSLTRMDAGTTLKIKQMAKTGGGGFAIAIQQDAGKTWNRVTQLVGGGSFQATAPNSTTADVRGTEFSIYIEVAPDGSKTVRVDTWDGSVDVKTPAGTVTVNKGQSTTVTSSSKPPSTPAAIPPGDRTDPFTIYNQTQDTTKGNTATIAPGTISQGQTTALQTGAIADGNTDLDFGLGWSSSASPAALATSVRGAAFGAASNPAAVLELIVYDPDTNEFQRASSDTPPVHVAVPRGRAGSWGFRVHCITCDQDQVWYVIIGKTTPSTQNPTPFFVLSGPCVHSVIGGQTDSWTLAARDAAGRPALTAGGLPGYGSFHDNGDGTGTFTFSPPLAQRAETASVTVNATLNGVSAPTLTCTETVKPVPLVQSVSPGAGPASGGTTVVITGSAFSGTSVSFGGTPAASFVVNSDSQITAVSPAHALGIVDVTVTTTNGTSPVTDADRFAFVPPGTFSSISPNGAPTDC